MYIDELYKNFDYIDSILGIDRKKELIKKKKEQKMKQETSEKILGVNKRYLPREDHSREIPYTVVLVSGDIGDYSAYAGLSEFPDFIARFGDKISFEEACCHFPGGQLKKEKYRV